MQQMPENIRIQLAQSTTTDPRELAKLADKIWAAKGVETFAIRTSQDEGKRSQKKKYPTTGNTNWCWYHQAYGTKAKKCIAPCEFQIQGNGSAGRQ